MNAHQVAISVFVWATAISAVFSCAAMVAVRDTFPRLHFMAPVANISAVLLVVAVALQEGWGQAVIKTLLIAGVMIVMNAVLAHATARAARVREFGEWDPHPGDAISTSHGQGQNQSERTRRSNE